MSTLTLNRETFRTNRTMEFFTMKELAMQIGYEKSQWPIVLVKELIDNALDACEQAGVTPSLTVTVEADAVTVQDNGPGLPAKVLHESLDYMIRVSNKSNYVSPTRGQLGNALKCVWAAPFVIDGERGKAEVHSHGQKHTIDVTLDRIAQVPVLEHTTGKSHVKNGTLVKIFWPSVAIATFKGKSRLFTKA
jgi:DNA topoisomerase-6 subunit B